MTEQSNDDLIAEARVIWEADDLYPDQMIPRLVMALEAADRRADQVEATAEHLHDEDTREIVALTQERDAALAVIEKVRAYAESIPRTRDRDVNPGLSNRSWLTAQDVLHVLAATAPADALREMKADVWDEGDAARRMYVENRRAGRNVTMPRNPYREEQDRG